MEIRIKEKEIKGMYVGVRSRDNNNRAGIVCCNGITEREVEFHK